MLDDHLPQRGIEIKKHLGMAHRWQWGYIKTSKWCKLPCCGFRADVEVFRGRWNVLQASDPLIPMQVHPAPSSNDTYMILYHIWPLREVPSFLNHVLSRMGHVLNQTILHFQLVLCFNIIWSSLFLMGETVTSRRNTVLEAIFAAHVHCSSVSSSAW